MGSTQFGNFDILCANATLPVCNLFNESTVRGGDGFGGCELVGVHLSGDRDLRNVGSIVIAFLAIIASAFMLFRSERKQAAVGRREIQLFLIGYIIIEICEIFTVGGIPFDNEKIVLGFTAVHLAAIAATSWILFLNAVVGYQVIDDGTLLSVGGLLISAALIFVGTGYIALDTAFHVTGHFDDPGPPFHDRNIGLFVLYQIFPLLCIVLFFLLETNLVLRVLGERRPMLYLLGALVLFAIGQVFQYVISPYICRGSNSAINGTLFETLFTLLAVVMTWVFWSSITEDDWPMPAPGEAYT